MTVQLHICAHEKENGMLVDVVMKYILILQLYVQMFVVQDSLEQYTSKRQKTKIRACQKTKLRTCTHIVARLHNTVRRCSTS